MAKKVKKPKKQAAKPKKRGRKVKAKRQEPFRPLAKGFKTEKDFNRAVKLRAQGEYKPQLDALRTESRTEASRHQGRARDIQGMGDSYTQQLQQAHQATQDALNNLIAQSTASNQAAQSNMVAALQATGAQDQQIAGMVGNASVPTADSGAITAASIANQGARENAQRGSFSALIGGSANRQSLGALNALRAIDTERVRTTAVEDELRKQRLALKGRIPEFREKARAAILDEERNKQNLRFQQGLANREFGLKKKQVRQEGRKLDLAEAQFGWQKQIDLQNIQLQRDQLAAEIQMAQQEASGSGDAERLELLGKRYDSAIEWLDAYMKPTKAEQRQMNAGKITRPRRSVEDVFRRLTGVNRLPKPVALKIISAQPNKAWRRWANVKLGTAKNLTFKEIVDKYGFDPSGKSVKKRLKPLRKLKR